MGYYTSINEGLFDRFKHKKMSKEELKSCERFLNGIYKKHFNAWKRIIEDSFRSMRLVRVNLDSNANFESDRNSKEMYLSMGKISMGIDNKDLDDGIKLDTSMCRYRLAEYNAENDIKFIRFNITDSVSIGSIYDIWLHVYCDQIIGLINDSNSMNESTIFSDIDFI